MGKERDEFIRRLGGTPISDRNLTDEEIIREAWNTYWEKGEIPPWIEECFTEEELVEMRKRLTNHLAEKNN